MELDRTGTVPGPHGGKPLSPDGPVDQGPYGVLLEYLGKLGYFPVFVEYDWRFSMAISVNDVLDKLNAITGDTQFIVIGHSEGGLLARLAWDQWRTRVDAGRWLKTLYFATPHGGTYSAVISAANPGQPYAFLYWLVGIFTSRWQRSLLGDINEDWKRSIMQCVASWPSLYELFPSHGFPYGQFDPLTDELYDDNLWTLNYDNKVSQKILDAAQQVQFVLNKQLLNPAPGEVNCLANDQPTAFRLSQADKGRFFRGHLHQENGYAWTTQGDGRVSVERGTLNNVPNLFFGADHQGLPKNPQLLGKLPELLAGPTPPSQTIPDPPPPPSTIVVESSGEAPVGPIVRLRPTVAKRADP
jgi:hypothetical protein